MRAGAPVLPDFLEVLAASALRIRDVVGGQGSCLLLPRPGAVGCRVIAPDDLSQRVVDALAGPSGGVVFSAARRLAVPLVARGKDLPPEARRLKTALRHAGSEQLVIVPLQAGPGVVACVAVTRDVTVASGPDATVSPTGAPKSAEPVPTGELARLWLAAGVRVLGAVLDDWHADPDSLPHGGVVVDRTGHILFAFGAVRRLSGWTHEDLVGQPIRGLPAGDDLLRLVTAPSAASRTDADGGPWVTCEAPATQARARGLDAGAPAPALAILVRDPDPASADGDEGAETIRELTETLHEALVGEGIYEYRADDPLADVLRQQRAWDQIERARRRVGPMGASLRLDLNDAFRRWMLAEGGALRAQGIRILSLLAPDLSPAAGDPVEVSRALRALWRDARVALRPAGGTITLRTWEDDGYVHCAVANDGSGVGAGRPSTAFRSLARPDDPPAHEASEEGMKRAGEVLEKLGGRLDVEVRPRVWTRRTVLVPATVVGPKVDHVDGAVRSADATPLGGRKMARAVEE